MPITLFIGVRSPSNDVTMSKRGHQTIVSEFNSHWVLHTSGLVLILLIFTNKYLLMIMF